MIDTKNKILDTAERLFGEQGYAATSLRHITAEAGVNLAAIHYHFGSKEGLLDHVVTRKAGPVNEQRLARLAELEAETGDGALSVEKVLEAFFAPMAEMADRDPQFVRMMGRMIAEGLMPGIVRKHFQPVTGRMMEALKRALPDLPESEFRWRMHFMIGAMAHMVCGVPDASGIGSESVGFRGRIGWLQAFAIGGFRAPASRTDGIEVR
jgi:AcrR family transcriptional regulator